MKYEMVKAYSESREQFGEDGPNETAFANCQAFVEDVAMLYPDGLPHFWFDDIPDCLCLGFGEQGYLGRAVVKFHSTGETILTLSGNPASEDVQPRVREVTGQPVAEVMAIVEKWLLP
jgi:hypothetical protein